MTTETIYYKVRDAKTKDPLRELADADKEYLKKVLACYQILAEWDDRPDFKTWFERPLEELPVQPQKNYERNSPRSFCEGLMDKLNQERRRQDLSPKVCDALEYLSILMAGLYEDSIPSIKFKDKIYKKSLATETNFTDLFKKIKTQ